MLPRPWCLPIFESEEKKAGSTSAAARPWNAGCAGGPMRCALFLAAWAVALAAAEPALDPWLQALYGRRRLQKKDVRLLKAKLGDEYGGSQAAAYDYGGDYAHVPPSSLLGRIFQGADLEYYDDEPTTLYCITVTPKPYTTQSTTPEVICFPPSRRPKTRTTTRTTTTTAAPVVYCENGQPQPPAHKASTTTTTTTTTTAKPHSHYGRTSSTISRHHQGHPEAVECTSDDHKARHVLPKSTHASSTRTTVRTRPSTAKTSTVSPSTQKKTTTRTTTRATTRPSTKHPTHIASHTHAPRTTNTTPFVGECAEVLLQAVTTSTSRKTTPKTTVTTHKHVTTTHRHTTTTHRLETTTHKRVTTHRTVTTHKPTTRKTVTTRKSTKARITTPQHVRKMSPPPGHEACEAVPQLAPIKTRRTVATPPAPKTRPPVDEFLAAWGFFKHHNSLDPRNASHWREFHGVDGLRAPRRRDVSKRDDVVVIVPPWLRQSAHPGLAFVVPPAQPLARRMTKREQHPAGPKLTFVVPPVQAGQQRTKREEQPDAASGAPYQVYWFSSWPPAGREVSRLPGRDKVNYAKLSDWWQDVRNTYNGHHRKKRGLERRYN
ncbi:hypothetical protein HPB50_022281 [Hyalomma asiaticum]|uniref:Uncharacterized protein n=1 Tax=Hyalomma asiaticum TaxID=266040 RepID=A0ACB7TM24_HYAAI|nr:hypothetical protein HPB50_022281 [Hyalomma asiaticum]